MSIYSFPQRSPTYLDYLEGLLEEIIRENNHRLVASLSLQQLSNLRARHRKGFEEFRSSIADESELGKLLQAPTPYRRKAAVLGEFRPILHSHIHRSTYAFGGSHTQTLELPGNMERLFTLKRFLLYSHRTVLPDPLWYIFAWLQGSETESYWVERTRAGLTNLLDFIYLIKDLIRSGTVLFYPQWELSGFSSRLFKNDEFLNWCSKLAPEEQAEVSEPRAYPQVIELLFYCLRHGASFFLDKPRMIPLFARMIDYGRALGGSYLVTSRDTAASQEDEALTVLSTTSLPLLDGLSLREIVALRRNSDAFSNFRDLLRKGLLRIDSGNPVDLGAIRQTLGDCLAEGRSACEKEIRASSLLNTVKPQSVEFTVGAVAGALMADPAGGLGTAPSDACLTVLNDYVAGVQEPGAETALLRHYVLWNEGKRMEERVTRLAGVIRGQPDPLQATS